MSIYILGEQPGTNHTNIHWIKNLWSIFSNPAVTEIADIKNIVQEVVATQNEKLFENYIRSKLYIGQKLSSNIPLVVQGVRVSFNVVPKDGGKTVHILKTFQANIVSVE